MRSGRELEELRSDEFIEELDALTEIYAAAMQAHPSLLPGRRALMERHASHRTFRVIVARLTPASQPVSGAARPFGGRSIRRPGRGRAATAGNAPAPIVGFAYGFHGSAGQWWHDLVAADLGASRARDWLGDSFEVAEVHVQPSYQGQGIGRAMMHRLTSGRPERTAVLSTPEGETRARRLYLSLGFADLLPMFYFPGSDQPYTIMGALLPLRGAARGGPCPGNPSL